MEKGLKVDAKLNCHQHARFSVSRSIKKNRGQFIKTNIVSIFHFSFNLFIEDETFNTIFAIEFIDFVVPDSIYLFILIEFTVFFTQIKNSLMKMKKKNTQSHE